MKRPITWFMTIGLLLNFWSCSKDPAENNCEQILKTKIAAEKTSFYVGDTIFLKTNIIPPISLFDWTRGENSNAHWGDATVSIYPCTKNDEGWYYLSVSYPDCAAIVDSVYISVTNNPAAPDCSPANNAVSFSSIPNINFNQTSWNWNSYLNCKLLHGEPASGDQTLNIYFNPYWTDHEPEDGAYNIYNIMDFDEAGDKYAVYIVSRYSGIDFQALPGKVYVSHVNNMLKVTFCSISLIGNNGGASYTTLATGAITAP